MYNEIIFCVLLSFPLCIVIYNFLPMVYISVYFGKDRWMKRDHESDIISKILSFLPFSNLLKKRIITRIEEAGIGDGRTWIFWLFMTLVLPVIVLILNISARAGMLSSVCIATGTAVIPEIWLNNRIASRSEERRVG